MKYFLIALFVTISTSLFSVPTILGQIQYADPNNLNEQIQDGVTSYFLDSTNSVNDKTILFPQNPVTGQTLTILCGSVQNGCIKHVTLVAPNAAIIHNPPGSANQTSGYTWFYNSVTNIWYRAY